ncbi:MAG: VWA domain-containing protein [Acidobacteria bacterium]|nr:VWA domain-containing protein [Acidobacteriota bacterium]
MSHGQLPLVTITLGCLFWFSPAPLRSADANLPQDPADKAATADASATVELKTRPQDSAQDRQNQRASVIKTDVDLVLINVTVTDPMGRMVTGLGKEHFEISEDKNKQEIVQFGAEDSPLSLAIVFDASGSMGEKMSKAREAVAQFFKTANPEDEFFLETFNNRPDMLTEFTDSLEDIQSRLTFIESKGRTALLDAIYLALNKMKEAKNQRKALLVISDGGDNSSRYTEREIKSLVRESDVQIYAIGIFEPYGARSRTPEELAGPGLLNDITEATGGRQFPVENLNELPDVAEKIGIELRNQYVLGYVPTNLDRDGKWRRVKVEIQKIRGMPQLRPYFRNGYYAPSR